MLTKKQLIQRIKELETAIDYALPLETFWLNYGKASKVSDTKPLSSVLNKDTSMTPKPLRNKAKFFPRIWAWVVNLFFCGD